ncbi:unnamed protein product, partial [marine sediment metagenome]
EHRNIAVAGSVTLKRECYCRQMAVAMIGWRGEVPG